MKLRDLAQKIPNIKTYSRFFNIQKLKKLSGTKTP